jgi:hypothetical protein
MILEQTKWGVNIKSTEAEGYNRKRNDTENFNFPNSIPFP